MVRARPAASSTPSPPPASRAARSAEDLLDVLVLVAAPEQFRRERRVFRDILETRTTLRDAVEVAAEADVIDAGDLADVIDVIGGVGERGARRRIAPPSTRRRRASTAAASFGNCRRQTILLGRLQLVPAATFGDRNPGTNVTMTTPPFFGSIWRTLSGTLRGTSFSARADECEKMTGAWLTRIASSIVSGETWLRSTSMPSQFISRTTSSPNGDRPPNFGASVAESAHGVLFVCVSVM